MKKAMIGGFLLLSGTIGLGSIFESAGSSLTDEWMTLLGRLVTTIITNGAMIPAIVFLVLLVLGLYILGVEYFKE